MKFATRYAAVAIFLAACGGTAKNPGGVDTLGRPPGTVLTAEACAGLPGGICYGGPTDDGGPGATCVVQANGAAAWECPVAVDTMARAPGTEVDAEACGPALGSPSIRCSDGSTGGNTGRCIAQEDGQLGWEMRNCPPDHEGDANAELDGGAN